MQVQRKTLTQLSIPICFETLFYMLAGMVDTLMPVSYTHLDVYKRQLLYSGCRSNNINVLFPFRYDINSETHSFGGIAMYICCLLYTSIY